MPVEAGMVFRDIDRKLQRVVQPHRRYRNGMHWQIEQLDNGKITTASEATIYRLLMRTRRYDDTHDDQDS